MVAHFIVGGADFIEQFQPEAELLVARGAGRVVASMGDAVGPISISSYIATQDYLARNSETGTKFLRAFYKALRWVHGHDASAIAVGRSGGGSGTNGQSIRSWQLVP